jgi:hypothetical protein
MNSQSKNTHGGVNWSFLLALIHTLVLACYALPDSIIPDKLEYWSSTYTRPLFHQQWNLFAPDVPPCGCTIAAFKNGVGTDLMTGKGMMERRLIKWGCRSMPNYRDATDSVPFRPWQGFNIYLAGMLGSTQVDSVAIVRTCFTGNRKRSIRTNFLNE